MLRVVLILVLLSEFLSGLPYEFAIPKVQNPDLNDKDFVEIPDNVTLPPGQMTLDEDGNLKFVTGAPNEEEPMAMWKMPLNTFRTRDFPLSEAKLRLAIRSYQLKAPLSDWKKFNKEADWTVIDSKNETNIYQMFAYRRAVVNDSLVRMFPDRIVNHDKLIIDYFDDYQVCTDCSSPKIGHSIDKVFIFRERLHYVKFSYVCRRSDPENVCLMSTIFDAPDLAQGWVNEQLNLSILRTMEGKQAIVFMWRNFWMCEKDDFVEKIYPTLSQRLDEVGLTEFDIKYKDNRNAMLSLNMFGLELLRSFRRQVPGFTEDMIKDLEHQEHLMFKREYENPNPKP